MIQFSVKHEQKIDCGGGYVKVFPSDQDQTDMHGDSKYYLMFGEWLNGSTEPDSLLMFRGSLRGETVCKMATWRQDKDYLN